MSYRARFAIEGRARERIFGEVLLETAASNRRDRELANEIISLAFPHTEGPIPETDRITAGKLKRLDELPFPEPKPVAIDKDFGLKIFKVENV